MKDLNGKEIDFEDEDLFPSEFMMPKRNRQGAEKIHSTFEEKSEDEVAEDISECMRSMNAILE
ncbi:MAG: hypothetical protein LBI14_00290 [Treponema sp.]|jgi:hypothetical protein|nr:hypothetical protein [Treponema sp.]